MRPLANDTGASSVLVIFMMMVLVTLGALALTSANVNYKLSRRTLEWNAMYYELDGQGDQFLSVLDGKLAAAEQMALDYLLNEGYRNSQMQGVTPEVQNAIFAGYRDNQITDVEILSKIYMYYADKYITEMLSDFSELEVYPIYNESFVDSIYTYVTIQSEQAVNELCSLKVSLAIDPLSYQVTGTGAILRENGSRYRIEGWYEYQEPLSDEPPAEELWDGSL